MSHRIPWRGLTVATVAVAALAGPAVSAASVDRIVVRNFTFVESPRFDCGAFQLDGVWTVSIQDTVVYDASGTPVNEFWQERFKGILTSSLSGATIADQGVYNFEVNPVTGVIVGSGTRHEHVPGLGYVLLDSGLVKWDLDWNVTSMAGPLQAAQYDLLGAADAIAELCAYMAA